MNKITTLAAISMFAVIMGMSAFTPALATPKGNSGTDAIVCHFFAEYETLDGELVLVDGEPVLIPELSEWNLLYLNSQGAVNGHTGNEDHDDMQWDGNSDSLEAFTLACDEKNL